MGIKAIRQPGTYAYDHTQTARLSEHLAKTAVKYKITPATPFKLERNQFVLGVTHERIELPIPATGDICLAARIEGKSSRARTGLLIHFTAPTVHPGFQGRLVLEMINLGAAPILLTPMMLIAQLIVEEVRGIPRRNDSQFQNQTGPEGTSGV
jgi:dCTP deaminase